MEKLSVFFSEKLITAISGLLFVSLLFLPFFKLTASAPGIEIIDMVMPLLGLIFISKWKQFEEKRLFLFIGAFAVYVLITIIVNSRLGELRDYFEIFKLVKFGIVIGLFSMISYRTFLREWIKPAFIVLVVFNLIHYFDLFGFNEILGEYYQAGERMSSFGYDSMGEPTYKRMLGFVCNPNNNGILFLFFCAFFIPKYGKKFISRQLVWFTVALIMVFLCQSRTSLLISGAMLVVYSAPILLKEYKNIVVLAAITGLSFLAATIITRVSVRSESMEPSFVNIYKLDYADSASVDSLITVQEDNDPLRIISTDTSDMVNGDPKVIYVGSAPDSSRGQGLDGRATYMETLMNGSAFQTYSMEGRILIWKHMWGMIKKKPVFGHGPYKEYFYDNVLYAESEYMMITWRYGFIGLAFYLVLMFYTLFISFKARRTEEGMILLIATIIMLLASVTNNPFAHKTILVMFGICLGFYLNSIKKPGVEGGQDSNENS